MEPIRLITPFAVTAVILVLAFILKSPLSAGRNKRLEIFPLAAALNQQHFSPQNDSLFFFSVDLLMLVT